MGVASGVASQAPNIPNSDVGTLIGWTGLGLGVIVLYGAVKGVPVFGPNGIITNAVTEGKLTHVVKGSGNSGSSTTTATPTGGIASNPPAKASQYLGDQATSMSRAGIQAATGTAPAPPSKPLSFWQQVFGYKPKGSSGGLFGFLTKGTSFDHTVGKGLAWTGHQLKTGLEDAWNTFAHPFG